MKRASVTHPSVTVVSLTHCHTAAGGPAEESRDARSLRQSDIAILIHQIITSPPIHMLPCLLEQRRRETDSLI